MNGLPLVNYPDVCTSSPLHGMAFCQEHIDFLSSQHPGIPTDIRGFLKYCGVLKDSDTSDSKCTVICTVLYRMLFVFFPTTKKMFRYMAFLNLAISCPKFVARMEN